MNKEFEEWLEEYIKRHNLNIEPHGLVRRRMGNAWQACEANSYNKVKNIIEEDDKIISLIGNKHTADYIKTLLGVLKKTFKIP